MVRPTTTLNVTGAGIFFAKSYIAAIVSQESSPKMKFRLPIISGTALFTLLFLAWMPADTFGTTFTVTNLANAGPGSLRTAISNSLSGDIITFATSGTIMLTSGELLITNNLTISGPGPTNLIVSGNVNSRVFVITSAVANVSISGITIRDGRAPNGSAGGSGQTGFPGSDGGYGGAIYNLATLTLTGCSLFNNVAGTGGAGGNGSGTLFSTGFSGTGGTGGTGGAIYNAGTLALAGCTLNNNFAGNGGNGGLQKIYTYGGSGGAAGDGGACYSTGPVALTNCTVVANNPGNPGSAGAGSGGPGTGSAGNPGYVGGFNVTGGSMKVIASTISGNSLAGISTSVTLAMRSSLIAGNYGGTGSDISGSVTSQGHNLIGNADGTYGNVTNGINGDRIGTGASPVNALLGPLANNGGPVLTLALLPGSPALETGDDALTNAPFNLGTDQRGFARKSGLHVDMGAFEHDSAAWPAVSVTTLGASAGASSSVSGTGPVTFNGSINPGGLIGTANFQYGLATNYGGIIPVTWTNFGTNAVAVNATTNGLGAGIIYHYRLVVTNADGTFTGNDQAFMVPALYVPGDLNGDGIVDQNELNLVLTNYWPHSPWLLMTNTAGLGTTNVQFTLPNPTAWNFTVEVSTNLVNWNALGSARPLYQFGDPAATNLPQHFYRLRYP